MVVTKVIFMAITVAVTPLTPNRRTDHGEYSGGLGNL